MIQTYKCGKDIRVIVWGCFWDTRRTSLYLIDRDFESKKHRYSANSYLKVLDAIVALAVEELNDPGYIHAGQRLYLYCLYSTRLV